MKFKNWTQVGWILTSLLLLSIGVISYSRESRSTRPTIDNYGPSGTAAFATLLSKNGYQIRNLTSTFPEVDPEDTIVAFVQNSEFDSGQSPAVFQYFNELAEGGNRVLILPLDNDFDVATKSTQPLVITDPLSKERLTVRMNPSESRFEVPGQPAGQVRVSKWVLGKDMAPSQPPAAELAKVGRGYEIIASDGIVATNRFIDKDQNAQYILDLVHTISGGSGTICFAEALYQPTEPGLLTVLGPWAEAGFWQMLFLFVVVVYTLGKRFGLPTDLRPVQVGQRDLAKAVADTYGRARVSQLAARSIYQSADRRLRKMLKLSPEAPPRDRDNLLSPEIVKALRDVDEASRQDLGPRETFHRCRALRERMQLDFLKN